MTGPLADEVALTASVDGFAVDGLDAVACNHVERLGLAGVRYELAIVAASVNGLVSIRYVSPKTIGGLHVCFLEIASAGAIQGPFASDHRAQDFVVITSVL